MRDSGSAIDSQMKRTPSIKSIESVRSPRESMGKNTLDPAKFGSETRSDTWQDSPTLTPAGSPRLRLSGEETAGKKSSLLSLKDSRNSSNAGPSPRSSKNMGAVGAMQAMDNRPGRMNATHIARPEGNKWSLAAKQALAGDHDGENKLFQKGGYTAVSDKEESLEAIMSAEAHLSFDCLGRHQFEAAYMTRNSMNPNGLRGKSMELHKMLQELGHDDLKDIVDDSDDEYAEKNGFKQWQAQPGDLSILPPSLTEKCNCRFGAALPVSKNTKVNIGTALGALLSSEGKGGGALAKAAELSMERTFAARCGDFCLAGVVNTHGNPKWAGSLAWCVAKEMPKAVFRSSAFKKNNPAKALSDAFSKVHCFAASQFDTSLTGAAVSVVLISKEHIWIAHVGDCRVVLGVPDGTGMSRDFHYTANAVTHDHKLCVKKEFDRIKAADGEVRKLMHDSVCRIFVGDTPWPCLALTRGIGDRLAHTVGVTHKPTISVLNRKDLAKGTFLVIGSSGLWACMSEKAAVNWLSRKHPDPQAAVMSLSSEAMKRWEAPNSKMKAHLDPTAKESFSSVLVRLEASEEEVPAQTPRKFVVGPVTLGGASIKPWKEVKSSNRVLELRRMAQHHEPTAEA